MQDGINNNTQYSFNSQYDDYTYMYYTNSDSKNQLESWYQTNIGSKSDLADKVVSGNYYCEQAKTKLDSSWISGSANMTVYSSYIPDFKCSSDGNGKGLVNANIGLITYDEAVYAGGYFSRNNSNYYLYNPAIYSWTMSPAGVASNYSYMWRIESGGYFWYLSSNSGSSLRAVINLKSDVKASGTGTSSDPFVVQ